MERRTDLEVQFPQHECPGRTPALHTAPCQSQRARRAMWATCRPAQLQADMDNEGGNTPWNTHAPENKSGVAPHRTTKLRESQRPRKMQTQKDAGAQSDIYSFIPQKWIRHLLCAGTGRQKTVFALTELMVWLERVSMETATIIQWAKNTNMKEEAQKESQRERHKEKPRGAEMEEGREETHRSA